MSQVPIEFKLPLLVHRCSGSWDLMWLMSLFFDLFVQLVSDFRLQLWQLKWRRLKWHRDSPRCLVIFAYDNMMHCTFLLAWVVSWKQLQYLSLRQVCQTPLSGNMAHGSTKEEWGAKGTSGFSAFIKKIRLHMNLNTNMTWFSVRGTYSWGG